MNSLQIYHDQFVSVQQLKHCLQASFTQFVVLHVYKLNFLVVL